MSGEQAEERTAREGRERAEAQLLDELGLSFHRVGNSLQVTLFDPFKIESLVPADKSYTAHFAMDKAWKRLIEKQAECSRLASRVEELEKGLAEAREGWMDSIDYEHEVGHAYGGNSVYPDKENCEANHPCIGKADQDGRVDCVAMRVKVIDAEKLEKLLAGAHAEEKPQDV